MLSLHVKDLWGLPDPSNLQQSPHRVEKKTKRDRVWLLSFPFSLAASSLRVAFFSSIFWKYALISYFYLHMYDHGTKVKNLSQSIKFKKNKNKKSPNQNKIKINQKQKENKNPNKTNQTKKPTKKPHLNYLQTKLNLQVNGVRAIQKYVYYQYTCTEKKPVLCQNAQESQLSPVLFNF